MRPLLALAPILLLASHAEAQPPQMSCPPPDVQVGGAFSSRWATVSASCFVCGEVIDDAVVCANAMCAASGIATPDPGFGAVEACAYQAVLCAIAADAVGVCAVAWCLESLVTTQDAISNPDRRCSAAVDCFAEAAGQRVDCPEVVVVVPP